MLQSLNLSSYGSALPRKLDPDLPYIVAVIVSKELVLLLQTIIVIYGTTHLRYGQ
jgi:hypothetical protein